eukprot:TRINITY_DN145_c0_g1_i1.p1 TRINITY_DN145_c0_g1~~TRINITY_DN145_c0_g1_i1.p1  ORF type:complete len:206 (+),score=11.12 TRINITY_DN145_c0_g1_i1:158-775(+)
MASLHMLSVLILSLAPLALCEDVPALLAEPGPAGVARFAAVSTSVHSTSASTAASTRPQKKFTKARRALPQGQVSSGKNPSGPAARRLASFCLTGARFDYCKRCVENGNICYNGVCYLPCQNPFPNFYKATCYNCPAGFPYFNCKDSRCYRCRQGANYFEGQCWVCPECTYWIGNKKCRRQSGECIGTTTSAVYCYEDDCKPQFR